MTVDNDHIKNLTEGFISKSIQDQDPAGLCFPTSLFLQVYLATKQIRSSLIKGAVPKLDNKEHYWLQIDSTDIIVDATIQQFKSPDPIYIGKLLDNEITKKYISSHIEFKEWFKVDFTNWNFQYFRTTDPLPLYTDFYINRTINYTIKLATILFEECKNVTVDEFTNHLYGLYLGHIYSFLYHLQKGILNFDIKKENMPAGFDNFLLVALQWGDAELKKQSEARQIN